MTDAGGTLASLAGAALALWLLYKIGQGIGWLCTKLYKWIRFETQQICPKCDTKLKSSGFDHKAQFWCDQCGWGRR